MKEQELDRVFQALAHVSRREILDIVASHPGCTIGYVADHYAISRISVLKHINVLEDAGLLISEKSGRERHLHMNSVPLQIIHERWSDQYKSFWASRLTRLKFAVEGSNTE